MIAYETRIIFQVGQYLKRMVLRDHGNGGKVMKGNIINRCMTTVV